MASSTLPQLTSSKLFLTEAGLETTLVYKRNIHLPCFSALPLLSTEEGKETLLSLYKDYVNIALAHSTGIILETRTWRGSPAWASQLDLSIPQILDLNRTAVQILHDLRAKMQTHSTPIVICGTLGTLQDAYIDSTETVSFSQAQENYRAQVQVLAEGVDMISIMTVTNLNEATAAVSVAREFNLPIHVSFSIETDGRLRGGRSLDEVIREVDRVTANYTTYFGVNCAHPRHIIMALRDLSEDVRSRIGSIRGNASLKSHDELDNSLVLDRGDISVWVQETIGILKMLPELKVVGGCCGTDEEHIDSLAGRIYSAGC
ncbi:Homocysteine S-methyltransferase [Penicillium griseofulvum]|uniref:Homocysteine S-methyltransferase n=1 Tax=Penicillium patulum TaxID=5078 RepID=A0A135LSZ0_PENPA|nr:Homocysteine S-methyltransferase [Penicillium griseofulvum]KXG52082.1 Homocysteine S-methyltransferase [Penicillium griseofulvum]